MSTWGPTVFTFRIPFTYPQVRIVKAALEAALEDLKSVCPAVMASRRDRSMMRAVPAVAHAMAGIVRRSTSEGLKASVCKMLGCSADEMEGRVEARLWEALTSQVE
jgi:hypothetical protein